MNKLDFDVINQALDPRTVVPQWCPGGYFRQNEYVAPNPTRDDRNIGSFSVNMVKGVWKEYATGEGGSDLVSLYAYVFGMSQGDAAKELAKNNGIRIGDPVQRKAAAEAAAANVAQIEAAQPKPIIPVPFRAKAVGDFNHPRYGDASAWWRYLGVDGETLLYVARFDPTGQRKQVLPRSWCFDPKDGTEKWMWKGPTGDDPRPLYGIDRLRSRPTEGGTMELGDVVLVEGEKTADAAQAFFGENAAVLAWLGGGSAADKVDVSPLAGRRVYLWPDFDSQSYRADNPDPEKAGKLRPFREQPGVKAMLALAQRLDGVAEAVSMVSYTPGNDFPDGWDLADTATNGWTATDVQAYMLQHQGDPRTLGMPPAPKAAPKPAPRTRDKPVCDLSGMCDLDGFPDRSSKNAPLSTWENIQYLLEEYGIRVRYNQVSKSMEIDIPGVSFPQDNRVGSSLALIGSLCSRNRMPKGDLQEYVTKIAHDDSYSPAVDWIDSKPWDGRDYIKQLAATLDPQGADVELAEILLRRWMIGAAQAAFTTEGMEMQGAIVLVGAQGTGKTTWFWSLSGRNKALARDGVSLRTENKDSHKNAISSWLVELGELDATFKKSDISALKAFLTQGVDDIRLPYARASSSFARRTAYVGTVNSAQYLHDDTGNRRFWTITPGPGLNGKHDVDMQQAWAQAKALWQSGEQHNLKREEMDRLNAINETHQEVNPIQDKIASRFRWGEPGVPTRGLSATDVLALCMIPNPSPKQMKDAGAVLRKLSGMTEPRKSNGRAVFDVPEEVRALVRAEHHDERRPF